MAESQIFNATLHQPTAAQLAAGVGPPRGREVPLGASFEDVRALARELVDEAAREGARTILIGGLSSLAMSIHAYASARGIRVVEALTLRTLDERGRFVFEHRGFRELGAPGETGEAGPSDEPEPAEAPSLSGPQGEAWLAGRPPLHWRIWGRTTSFFRYLRNEKFNYALLLLAVSAAAVWFALFADAGRQDAADDFWRYTEPVTGLATLVAVLFAWAAGLLAAGEKTDPVTLVLVSRETEERLELPYRPQRGQLSRAELMGILSLYTGKERIDFTPVLRPVLEPYGSGRVSRLDDVLVGRRSEMEIPLDGPMFHGFVRRLGATVTSIGSKAEGPEAADSSGPAG